MGVTELVFYGVVIMTRQNFKSWKVLETVSSHLEPKKKYREGRDVHSEHCHPSTSCSNFSRIGHRNCKMPGRSWLSPCLCYQKCPALRMGKSDKELLWAYRYFSLPTMGGCVCAGVVTTVVEDGVGITRGKYKTPKSWSLNFNTIRV